MKSPIKVDALVVGAGFAGMYMLYRFRQLGLRTLVIDKADGVGGTWYWNRYPGARCDIESIQYSYSFDKALEQEWIWSERYATQAEILDYANHVADRYDLRKDIQFGTEALSIIYQNSDQSLWRITQRLDDGKMQAVEARFCIMATGCLSTVNTPQFPGLKSFKGPCYHTGNWPHQSIDFSGQRVGLIGTGSSGIQSTSVIARQAKHLSVFQRTPNYVIPANSRPFAAGELETLKSNYQAIRDLAKLARNGVAQEIVTESALSFSEAERQNTYSDRWQKGGLTFVGAFGDLLLNAESNQTAADFVRTQIKKIVKDSQTATLLSPDSTLGCKRLCVDSDYYSTFNRENVELVDISDNGITEITENGPLANGKEYKVDALVLATGFDAMTGTLNKIDITGRNGRTLKDKWQDGPISYLGLMVAEFPNLFTITGPGSPSVLSNMLGSIEYHVDWITSCITYMQRQNFNQIEATKQAEDEWAKVIRRVVGKTLYPTCNSWYLGANISAKPRVFMPYPGIPPYIKKCNQIASSGYPGFEFTS